MPPAYYWVAIGIGILLLFALRRKSVGKRFAIAILVAYLFLLLSSTVLKRRTHTRYMLQLIPFRAVRFILRNGFRRSKYQISQVLLNILLLSPVGFLMPAFVKKRRWVILFGFGFSLFIEVSQLLLKRGYFEVDDILNNVIGVIISCGIYTMIEKGISLMLRRQSGDEGSSYADK